MPLENPNPTTANSLPPVLSRTAIGQRFHGVMCDFPLNRPRHKQDGTPVLKDNGQPSNELVVTLLTVSSTMPVGKVGEHRTPEPGEPVRLILKGKAYGDWIDGQKELGHAMRVGDMVIADTTYGQAYDEKTPVGPKLTTQAECDAVPRGRTLGYYGTITLREAAPGEATWDAKACQFYNDRQRPVQEEADATPARPFGI